MKSFLLLFILFSIVCYADIEMTPSQVLNEAKNVARNTSFSAKMTSSVNGQNISFMYYKSVNANGTIFTLMKPIEKKIKTSFLVNTKGRFEVIGDTAIRTDYIKKPQIISPIIPIRKNDNTFLVDGKEVTKEMIGDANFAKLEAISNGAKRNTANGSNFQNITCRKVDYSDRPCYLLIYKYNTDDGLFTNEEIIDRNTFLTYQIQTFAPSGKLTSKIIYTDIVINPIFEKDFFELPRGTTVVVAKTLKDANRESSIALDKVSPPPLSKKHPFSVSTWTNQFGSRIVNTFGNNVSILSYIFATIAILILVSVIITKVEKHQ